LPVERSSSICRTTAGTIHIELRQAQVRIEGSAIQVGAGVAGVPASMIGLPAKHAFGSRQA